MSRSEAEALAAIFAKIGGYHNGTRGRVNAMSVALAAAGISYLNRGEFTNAYTELSGELTFNDGSPRHV